MTDVPAPAPGDHVAHYRVDSVVRREGATTVLDATDTRLGRRVTLRVVPAGGDGESDEAAERFRREAATLARLESPHVLAVYDSGSDAGHLWSATQRPAGGDLADVLATYGRVPPEPAALLCSQVADALVLPHRSEVAPATVRAEDVLLRDPWPSAHGAAPHVLLTGLAEAAHGGGATPAANITDVGRLLWHLLTGSPADHDVTPFGGADRMTRGLDEVLRRTGAAPGASERFTDVAVLRDALRLIAGEALPAGTPPPLRAWEATAPAYGPVGGGTEASTPPARRRTPLLVAGAVALVLAVAVGIGAALLTGGSDPSDVAGGSGSTPTGGATEGGTAAPTVVAGDLTGDGYGDLALSESRVAVVWRSNGTTFKRSPGRLVAQPAVTGDFTEGAGLETVALSGTEPSLTAALLDAEGTTVATSPLETGEGSSYEVQVAAADVDGDGRDDLVVLTGASSPRRLVVGLNTGDGTFGAASVWFEGDLPTTARVVGGDVDGDGTDEVLVVGSSDASYTDTLDVQLLDAADGALSEVTTHGVTGGGGVTRVEDVAATDVDGDGTDELVAFSLGSYSGDSTTVTVTSYDGGEPTVADWYDDDLRRAEGDYSGTLLMTDVDGDGRTDLVLPQASDSNAHVLLSDGEAFVEDASWTAPLKGYPSDSTSWEPLGGSAG